MEKKEKYNFDDFKEIMNTLISEDGCPWDKIQTHETLKRYLIEESYEVLEAIENKDKENLCEELGDVLLQVVFHSVLAEKEKEFTLDDVINGVSKKMIFRHPHIFSNANAETAEDVLLSWEELKKKEKGYEKQSEVLKSVPKHFPALMRADKVLKKASDSNNEKSSLKEAVESLKQLVNTIDTESIDKNNTNDELIGEILLKTSNISKFLKINSEFALTKSIEKFINNFEENENKK